MTKSKTKTIWDYIFIGAGPSTLAAIGFLARNGWNERVLVLDSGKKISKRGCPGLFKNTCSKCNGDDCHVINGIGGASAWLGNKMCHFPASDTALSFIPGRFLPDVYKYVQGVTNLNHLDISAMGNVVPHAGSAKRKLYPAEILNKQAYGKLIASLVNRIATKASMRNGTAVQDIEIKDEHDFMLTLSDGSFERAKNVVIACGRSGHRFLRPMLKKLGVAYQENVPDIGIRLEASTELFSDRFFYQNDPKYKFTHGELGSSRTFCACKDGAIIPVKYGHGFFADGAFLEGPTGNTNVALMVRDTVGLSDPEIDKWCEAVNKRSDGDLHILEADFAISSENDFVERIINEIPWPRESHKALMKQLLDNIVLGRYIKMFSPEGPKSNKVRVFGPSVDLYWPKPTLKTGFETTTSGVYIIGDATGASRGIVQAIASGAGWSLVEMERKGNWQERAISCSGS